MNDNQLQQLINTLNEIKAAHGQMTQQETADYILRYIDIILK